MFSPQSKQLQKQRMSQFKQYGAMYRQELLKQVVPFWEKYSIDKQYGGFITCINQKGQIYDTDKFVWLQCRQIWTFAMLYNQVENNQAWLQIAKNGAQFINKYGTDQNGNWYFSLTRQGKPLVQPYNIFSDCFAAMCFSQLYKSTQCPQYRQIALKTYKNILQKQHNPKQQWNKSYPNSRNLRNFALPMILCNLSLILEDVLGTQAVDNMVKPLISDIMTNFIDKETGIILQNITQQNQFSDSHQGRVINPGHGNQSIWFLLDLAVRYQDQQLVEKLVELLLRITEFGWDQKYGGIYYFLDIKGHPVQQLEWDQKLWWVHLQTMISFIKAYKLTGNQKCKDWFLRIHEYVWSKFRDAQNGGEWFGYLNRQGQVLLRLKGGKWKGCFHVPRALFQLWKTIECND